MILEQKQDIREELSGEEQVAADFLILLGKYLRRIDTEMKKERKEPISKKLLGKEDMKVEDVIKIVHAISKRFHYLEEEDLENFSLYQTNEKISRDLIKGLYNLQRRKLIYLLIFYGYIMK